MLFPAKKPGLWLTDPAGLPIKSLVFSGKQLELMSRLRISEKTAFSTRIEKHVFFSFILTRLFFLSLSKRHFDHMFLGVFCITFSKFHLLLILLFFGFFKKSTGIRFQNIELRMPPLCMSVTDMILNSKCNLVSRKIEIFTRYIENKLVKLFYYYVLLKQMHISIVFF